MHITDHAVTDDDAVYRNIEDNSAEAVISADHPSSNRAVMGVRAKPSGGPRLKPSERGDLCVKEELSAALSGIGVRRDGPSVRVPGGVHGHCIDIVGIRRTGEVEPLTGPFLIHCPAIPFPRRHKIKGLVGTDGGFPIGKLVVVGPGTSGRVGIAREGGRGRALSNHRERAEDQKRRRP